MPTHVALLRGINLGPKRRVPMPELRAALADAGFGDVRTLLASGNVVVDDDGTPDDVASRVASVIADAFELDVGVVVRTAAELADVAARNPLADVATEPKRLQVVFSGREAYAWHPDGIQASKLARLLAGERLGLATARNWNTVMKLRELAA